MADLKHWCHIICVTVIVSGVLLSFLPQNKLKKSYKGFVSILLIFIFVSPFSDLKDIGSYFKKISDTNNVSEQELMLQNSTVVIDCAENILEERLNTLLEEYEFKAECKAYITEENSEAKLEKIDIIGRLSSDEKEKISKLLTDATGGDTLIEFVG